MQVDTMPFPVNALEWKNPAVLVRLYQAESTIGNNMIIGDPREHAKIEKNSGCEIVIIEKSVDARENIKITINQVFLAQWPVKSLARELKDDIAAV